MLERNKTLDEILHSIRTDRFTAAMINDFANKDALMNEINNCEFLHRAVEKGNVDSVRALLQAGADIEARDFTRFTPLMIAACYGKVNCLDELIVQRADVNYHEKFGMTPLICAVWEKQPKCLEKLLQAGAKIEIPHRYNVLNKSVRNGDLQSITILLNAGVRFNSEYANPASIFKCILFKDQSSPFVFSALNVLCKKIKEYGYENDPIHQSAENYLAKLNKFHAIHNKNIHDSIDPQKAMPTVLLDIIMGYLPEVRFKHKKFKFFRAKRIDEFLEKEYKFLDTLNNFPISIKKRKKPAIVADEDDGIYKRLRSRTIVS